MEFAEGVPPRVLPTWVCESARPAHIIHTTCEIPLPHADCS